MHRFTKIRANDARVCLEWDIVLAHECNLATTLSLAPAYNLVLEGAVALALNFEH